MAGEWHGLCESGLIETWVMMEEGQRGGGNDPQHVVHCKVAGTDM
jgi:hypothetical protein